MDKRIVTIENKKTKEKIQITWLEAISYYEGHSSFDELKQKYSEDKHENKKSKL